MTTMEELEQRELERALGQPEDVVDPDDVVEVPDPEDDDVSDDEGTDGLPDEE